MQFGSVNFEFKKYNHENQDYQTKKTVVLVYIKQDIYKYIIN